MGKVLTGAVALSMKHRNIAKYFARLGGKGRQAKLSSKERSEIARKLNKIRWDKYREKQALLEAIGIAEHKANAKGECITCGEDK